MDFNDFSARLKRTMSSLNARFNEDIAVYVTHTKKDDHEEFKWSYGNEDEETLINKIFIIFYNLASLKDHLKKEFKLKQLDSKIIEDEINSSLHLQVLIDLVNQEKHGYPLTITNRSGKNPLLKFPKQVLSLSVSEPNSIASVTHGLTSVNTQGNVKNMIHADIFDDKGNLLFSLNTLVETAYSKFEAIAKQYNCY